MCGRFAQFSSKSIIVEEFEIEEEGGDLNPVYNIAPGQEIAVVVNEKKNRLIQCKWGLIPSWAKNSSIGNKMINARSETIAEKPSFKDAFLKTHCLIVADGFYEWKRDGNLKIPVYIHLKDGKPFGLAGLFTSWISPDGDQIRTCIIITTGANELLKHVHHRMPVIIPKKDRDRWLDCTASNKTELLSMLIPYNSEKMETYNISSFVNSPLNNSPECIKPVI